MCSSSSTRLPAPQAVQQVLHDMKGQRAFLVGSAAAAVHYQLPDAYSDVDLFVPNAGSYFTSVQHLLDSGYRHENDKFKRVWDRHLSYGFNNWHTNSMKLLSNASDLEVNVIYKRVDGHETTRLSQVLESFDFGLLALGYETQTGRFHDMRPYFFGAGCDNTTPLGLLPYREASLHQGYMSQHIMLRTPGRYARYAHSYGYDLSLVKPVLIAGYLNYAEYKKNRSSNDDLLLASIAESLAAHIELDEFDELVKFEKGLPAADTLDQIYQSLE